MDKMRVPLGWLLLLAGTSGGLFLMYVIIDGYGYVMFSKSSERYEALMMPALAGLASFPVWSIAALGVKLLEETLHRLVVMGIYGVTLGSLLHAAFCLTL